MQVDTRVADGAASAATPRAHGAAAGDATRGEQILAMEQWLPLPPEEIFPFFANPYNLEKITPEFLRFQVLRSSTSALRAGTEIDYRLRLHGIPIRWRTLIEEWEPPRRFVDRQIRGPYELWHHTHQLAPRDGGTEVRDRVRYRLPLGALGAWAAGSWVKRDLARIFAFRRRALEAILTARGGAGRVPA